MEEPKDWYESCLHSVTRLKIDLSRFSGGEPIVTTRCQNAVAFVNWARTQGADEAVHQAIDSRLAQAAYSSYAELAEWRSSLPESRKGEERPDRFLLLIVSLLVLLPRELLSDAATSL